MPQIGDVLASRYRLVEHLGRGGMAEVFAAEDEVLGRTVAVKVLAPHLLDDERAATRFQKEARTAAAVTHPGIVTLYDTVQEGESHLLVMELVDGPTLAEHLSSRGPLPIPEALALSAAVADALAAAHDAGLVHRDIKPANILIADDGGPKITDFGIARVIDATTTATTTVYGSVPYVSPEQASGEPVGPASDLYSLGCVIFEMLTGRPPFVGDTPTATISQHLHRDPPALLELRPDATSDVETVVRRLLAKSPDQRYPTAAALARDLRRLADSQPPDHATAVLPPAVTDTTMVIQPEPDAADSRATSSPSGPRGGRRWIWVAVIAIAAAGLLWRPWDRPDASSVGVDPSETAASSTPPSAPTTPSPSPTETEVTPAPPSSLDDAVARFRQTLVEGRNAGLVGDKGVEELDKLMAEILEQHAEGKQRDLEKRLDELSKKLDEFVEKGQIDPEFAPKLRARADDVQRLAG